MGGFLEKIKITLFKRGEDKKIPKKNEIPSLLEKQKKNLKEEVEKTLVGQKWEKQEKLLWKLCSGGLEEKVNAMKEAQAYRTREIVDALRSFAENKNENFVLRFSALVALEEMLKQNKKDSLAEKIIECAIPLATKDDEDASIRHLAVRILAITPWREDVREVLAALAAKPGENENTKELAAEALKKI
jgi:hypothetical protein